MPLFCSCPNLFITAIVMSQYTYTKLPSEYLDLPSYCDDLKMSPCDGHLDMLKFYETHEMSPCNGHIAVLEWYYATHNETQHSSSDNWCHKIYELYKTIIQKVKID